jgi:thiol-disulfide isomerase/thioredoxin
MNTVAEVSNDAGLEKPQTKIEALLARAHELDQEDDAQAAIEILETALAQVRETPYQVDFQTQINLAIELAEAYLEVDEIEKARLVLDERAAFAEKIFQIMQATGTPAHKRAAAGGRVQIRDRARQVALLGQVAPEIAVKDWIKGEAATLASLRGRVVLLEFWATWCKPCQAMFPKLKALDEEYGERGLQVVALTRHYFAYRGTAESQAEELELMRGVVREHDLQFRVGVAETESVQELYGATGMPTLALIDRKGVVRYAHFGGGEDHRFNEILKKCLDEQV